MKFREIAIPVRLDEATFRRYCHFDTMLLHRRWFKPVLIGNAIDAITDGIFLGHLIHPVLEIIRQIILVIFITAVFSKIRRQNPFCIKRPLKSSILIKFISRLPILTVFYPCTF